MYISIFMLSVFSHSVRTMFTDECVECVESWDLKFVKALRCIRYNAVPILIAEFLLPSNREDLNSVFFIRLMNEMKHFSPS